MAWLRLFSHGIHRIHRSFVALIRPRNSQNSQKLGCVSPPTDFTDLHRWLGCVGPPTDFTEFTEVRLHKSSHRFHGFAQMAWSRLFSHGIHGIHRSFVASVLPRISQICTDGLVASVLPRNSQNSQKFGGAVGCVGMAGCHTLLICAHPCASVRICGRLFSARNFCAFRGFCGNIVSHGLHRFAQMAWLRLFFHGIHRSFGVLLAAWVWQDAIPSYICVNPCYLLETLLCKKLLCVPWVLWEYSLPRISQINTDGWLR